MYYSTIVQYTSNEEDIFEKYISSYYPLMYVRTHRYYHEQYL